MILNLLFLLHIFNLESPSSIVKEAEITGNFKAVYSDNLDNLFAINQKNNLVKLNLEGNVLFTFEDKSFPIQHADVSNPLRIIVYNQLQNSILFLDKTLSPFAERIQVDQLDVPYTNCVAASRDNNFWVFDDSKQSLKKFNQQSQEISNSGNLTSVAGMSFQPIQLIENENKVYALDSINGVFQFDYLGTFLFNFKEIKGSKISIKGSNIFYLQNNQLFKYDTILMEKQKIILPESLIIKDFALSQKKLFILTEQNLHIFRSGL